MIRPILAIGYCQSPNVILSSEWEASGKWYRRLERFRARDSSSVGLSRGRQGPLMRKQSEEARHAECGRAIPWSWEGAWATPLGNSDCPWSAEDATTGSIDSGDRGGQHG